MRETFALRRRRTRAGVCRVACASALVLLAAGCATTPLNELARPRFEMPARFAQTGSADMRTDWWQAFDDPELDHLVNRALAHNFTLASAYARVEQARATLGSARADLFPSVDASFEQSATRRANGDSDFATTAGNNGFSIDQDNGNWSDTRTFQFSAAYELDLWGRLRNARDAAAFEASASAADLQAAAITLASDIASNWYQLQELEARITALQKDNMRHSNRGHIPTPGFQNSRATVRSNL